MTADKDDPTPQPPEPERPLRPEGGDASSDAADMRVADFLANDSSGVARERRKVLEEGGEMASDVIGRLNALEFVGSLVGESPDMPDVLGDYRITGLLGRGGMGTVYEAFQESLDREVAIKVLSPSFSADLTMRKRFRSEAKLTASLHHQHIVPIYDYGEVAGYMFFAMEKVDGISLDKHIAAARRRKETFYDPRHAARRFAGVADALGHAHRRRLLHRDVKPGNILVAADGTLALADFGLSKVLGGGHGEASAQLTTQGGFLGTLHYASPEQALGKDLSPASDLYSLGVTLYESIAGCLPRRGKNTEALLQAILQEEPRRLRSEVPDAPRDLEAVLHKLLQRDPEERYKDGESLARDLRRVADGDPVQIRRQPVLQRVWRRAKRNPGMAAATVVAGVLLLVAAALLFGMVEARRESRASQRELALTEALAHARTDEGDLGDRVDRLVALTGAAFAGASPRSNAVEDLERAAELDPSDPRPERYRRALLMDPLPSVTEGLRAGRGWEMQRILDVEVLRAFEEAASGDRAEELRLYQLYLARAVARLSESVGNGDGAHTDLVLAGFLRPGAFPSQALMLVASLAVGESVDAVLARSRVLMAEAPRDGAQLVGELLACASGLVRRPAANMMRLDLAFAERVALFNAASAILGRDLAIVDAAATSTGGEAILADTLARALRAAEVGDLGTVESMLDALDTELRTLSAPEGPMGRWALAAHVLRDPVGARVPVGLDGASVSPIDMLRGYDLLLDLEPDPAWLGGAQEAIEATCLQADGHPLAGRIQARLILAGSGARSQPEVAERAIQAATSWGAADPADPEPLLVRAQIWLRQREVERFVDDACRAIQRAARRESLFDRVVAILRAEIALAQEDAPLRDRLGAALSAFEEARP